jgi:hypothetical protein
MKVKKGSKLRNVEDLYGMKHKQAKVISIYENTLSASDLQTGENFQSETSNGIEREITVYNADGKPIMHFKGKFDVSHSNRSLQYVDQHNHKHNIYFGDNTTVIVNELK